MQNGLGIAVARKTYAAYRALLASDRWQRLAAAGARPQRLLWASTGVKDPAAPDTLYVGALAAPDTVNTVPENTLRGFADHGVVSGPMSEDAAAADALLATYRSRGVDLEALAATLQNDGADAFVKSWQRLLQRLDEKVRALDAR
jgi:transaldolase